MTQGVRSKKMLMLSSTMELSIVDFMNNNELNQVPAPEPVVKPAGIWVPQKEYQDFKNQQVAETARDHRLDIKIRIFYILLAIGGLLVAVAFIGNFISPIEASEIGSRCERKIFQTAQFQLNFIGYPLLLATGIFGATIKKKPVRHIGIYLIILAPIIGLFFFFSSVAKAFCGI